MQPHSPISPANFLAVSAAVFGPKRGEQVRRLNIRDNTTIRYYTWSKRLLYFRPTRCYPG